MPPFSFQSDRSVPALYRSNDYGYGRGNGRHVNGDHGHVSVLCADAGCLLPRDEGGELI